MWLRQQSQHDESHLTFWFPSHKTAKSLKCIQWHVKSPSKWRSIHTPSREITLFMFIFFNFSCFFFSWHKWASIENDPSQLTCILYICVHSYMFSTYISYTPLHLVCILVHRLTVWPAYIQYIRLYAAVHIIYFLYVLELQWLIHQIIDGQKINQQYFVNLLIKQSHQIFSASRLLDVRICFSSSRQ